jgi:hypothetical protein
MNYIMQSYINELRKIKGDTNLLTPDEMIEKYDRLQDFDSYLWSLLYFYSVIFFNGIHTYIMLTWSESWASGSILLILFTLFHYT